MNDKEMHEELQDNRLVALELKVDTLVSALNIVQQALEAQHSLNKSMIHAIEKTTSK